MERYMLFFDIDGTLIDDATGIVPQSTVDSLHEARKNGHLLFLCTGRCKSIWPQDILDIGFDGVVGGCGTHILYHGEELLHATIAPKLQREIADDMLRFHVDGILEGPDSAYFRRDMWIPVVKNIYRENGSYSANCQKFMDEELDFDKLVVWFDETGDIDSFKKKYEDRFDFILRDPTFYEIVPRGYSKGTGIALLCEHLGIDPACTIGFGDSTNDLPMWEYSGVSVALGSGNPDVFAAVDYVTAPVMEDGIEKALKKYNIIE